jgi:two-component system, OmpR family, phosphate regulon sensor histidine kinase PhoR
MFERKSIKWPIFLAVIMIVLLVSLMIGWVLLNVFGWQSGELSTTVYWILISVGSTMFTCVVAGVVFYLILTIQQINLTRRQSNFIDAVTHELKSPIASLKLYVQTLKRHSMDQAQRDDFYVAMLQDVERLDLLITQLLDVARLSHREADELTEVSEVRIDKIVEQIVGDLENKYSEEVTLAAREKAGFPPQDQVLENDSLERWLNLSVQPILLPCKSVDIDVLFRNLIDNACKYAGSPPKVSVEIGLEASTGIIHASITDNGKGIPRSMRRRIFNRFFRIGDELERTKTGTGLGLFLVRTVLRRLKGSITIHDGAQHQGTRFELRIPGGKSET